MTRDEFQQQLTQIAAEKIPLPGAGETPARHRRLMEIGRQDLSLAKIAEAHWDALAILAEAGRTAVSGALYAVWASEVPGHAVRLIPHQGGFLIDGKKMFSSGAGLVDRALVTAGEPEQFLLDLDLRAGHAAELEIDTSVWTVDAFALTQTATLTFNAFPVSAAAVVCGPDWYGDRPGFWLGAIGPAACWAGGVAGLLDFAMLSHRDDPHTLAHLAAMHANLWALESYLDAAGREIDTAQPDVRRDKLRALEVRHLVEQACTDTLRRFARAYGPYPIAMNPEIARRYREADLYLRQSHGERDLEALAHVIRPTTP